ncbi:MAG: hypothetical protein P8104_11565, partial [Gammaproteobacteria bacterium]
SLQPVKQADETATVRVSPSPTDPTDSSRAPSKNNRLGNIGDFGDLFLGFFARNALKGTMLAAGMIVGITLAVGLLSNPITLVPGLLVGAALGAALFYAWGLMMNGKAL